MESSRGTGKDRCELRVMVDEIASRLPYWIDQCYDLLVVSSMRTGG